ncbi:MAG: exonuclease subunit SbcD [Clostridia bacterium]|nr:exonuclease subunit SbcD [Clostridia bacterium]
MKILHTSDWHLGKKLKNISRIEEQKLVLNELVNYVNNNDVDVVIVSGDVFDTYFPSSIAEELYFNTLKKLSNGERLVICISGNHDDNNRITVGSSVCFDFGIVFSDVLYQNTLNLKRVSLIESGERYFVVRSNNGETVFFNALSYPTEYRLQAVVEESKNYEDCVKNWVMETSVKNVNNYPEVFIGHLFLLGGVNDGVEKQIELGGARILNKNVLPPNAVYSALGHLHKRQIIDKERNIIYSGSILQYNYGESEQKSFEVFEIINGNVQNLKTVNFESGKKLKVVEVFDFNKCHEILNTFKNCYVKLVLHMAEPLTTIQTVEIIKNFPFVTEIELINSQELVFDSVMDRRKLNDKELFLEYYKKIFTGEPKEELVELYLKMLNGEVEDEAN